MLGLTILGNNSAIPAFNRHPTSQALIFGDQVFLIDCGEGTQAQLAKYKIRRNKINHIFISHLHGDHYFGLIGLITSMSLMGRSNPLHIYSPAALKDIINLQLSVASASLPFPLHFHANPPNKRDVILSDEKIEVSCFPVQHRIPSHGFLFKEKKQPRKINKDAAAIEQIPVTFYKQLQQGEDYTTEDGRIIQNERVTFQNTIAKTYAYSADTIFDLSLCEIFYGVDLLYHEATYLDDLQQLAAARFHTTTKQAATIAKQAAAKRLLIGHFSSKYEALHELLEESCSVFENTELALEGATYII